MPKQQQSIRDFSGGINRGSNKKNLKDNQLVESKNFISDAVGQITTIQDEVIESTNSFNDSMPDGNGKNIHHWNSDYGFDLSQSNNLGAPSITEVDAPKQAVIRLYFSTDYGAWNVGSRSLNIYNHDSNNTILQWTNGNKGGEFWTSYNSNKEAQGNTVKALEELANTTTTNNDGYTGSIPRLFKFYDPNSTSAVSYSDEADNEDHLSATTASLNESGGSNKFVVQKITDTDFGSDVATYPVWMMELEFDYYGKINYSVSGNWADNRKRKPSSGDLTHDNATITWANYNTDITTSNTTFNQSANAVLWNASGANSVFGQFSKWKYGVKNISPYKQHLYTVTIQVWTNANQSTHAEQVLTYTNIQGEDVEDLISGLFGGSGSSSGKISSTTIPEDQDVYWRRTADGVEIYQDVNTKLPYGIKNITVSRTNEVDFSSTQSSGDKESHLVAVAMDNSQASVYSIQDDQWTDWTIDLKEDDSITNNSDLSFFDSEGYLSICDSSFRLNNKPKWFGYLSTDKTYLLGDLMGSDFTTCDLAPTPYEEEISSGSLVQDTRPNQWSHMGMSLEDRNEFFNNSNEGIIFGRHGAGTDEDTSKIKIKNVQDVKYGVEASGLKTYIEFLDGTTTNDTNANTVGTFMKTNYVELYFTYVYEGGYVSRPKRFQVDATSASKNYQSNASKEDSRAMGIMVLIGRQLSGGTGTVAYNERLKGIEIWAKYTESDPSNIYLICEIDLNKGFRSNLSGDWHALSTLTLNGQHQGYSTGALAYNTNGGYVGHKRSNYLIFNSPNLTESFYQRYGLDYKDPIGFDTGGAGWKSACIFNRRAYYGNVHIRGKEDSLVYKPDGILKSAVGMYGTVGISNLVEASINDGDEITSLQVVGNKLLQFKKHSLAIMGIKILENGQSREFIEQIVHHVGVQSDNQVAQTPYGLFWVSRSGIYIYNGESIQRLTDNPEGSNISKTEWETFYNSRLHCGYDAYWNQVVIARDLRDNTETLIYSFNNRAFSSSDDMFDSTKKSGFAQTRDGRLLWAEEFNNSGSAGITANNGANIPKNKNTGYTATNQKAVRDEIN